MEQENEKILSAAYSRNTAEAQEMLNRRRSPDNASEVVAWVGISGNIIKSFHDGYISDKDIENRKNFMDLSFYRESLMMTSLGLLEKSDDPKAKEQIEPLKRLLSVVRICRANIIKNTPPRNIAKIIQAKQIAEKEKRETKELPEESAPQNTSLSHSPDLFDLFNIKKGQKPKAAIAALAALMLLEAGRKRAEGLPLDEVSRQAAKYLLASDFSQEEILKIVKCDTKNQADIADMKEVFAKHGLDEAVPYMLYAGQNCDHMQLLREAIQRSDITKPTAYDYSLANPLLEERIAGKSREDLIEHQKQMLALRAKQFAERNTSQNYVSNKMSFSVDNFYKKSNDLQRR